MVVKTTSKRAKSEGMMCWEIWFSIFVLGLILNGGMEGATNIGPCVERDREPMSVVQNRPVYDGHQEWESHNCGIKQAM